MVFAYSPSSPSTSYYTTPAMEIPTSSRSRSLSPSCAYPSWPQGSSLSNSSTSARTACQSTSFIISDEELFAPVFDETSSSSSSSRDVSPPTTPHAHISRSPAEPACAAFEHDAGSLMRHVVAQEKARREMQRRRKASAMKKRAHSSGKNMTPIVE